MPNRHRRRVLPKAKGWRWAAFFAAYRLELRLLAHNRLYLLFNLAWAGLMVWTQRDSLATTTAGTLLLNGLNRFVLVMVCAVGLLVIGFSAGRGRRTRFDVIESTLPIGSEAVLARWLATATALMTLMLPPLVAALVAGPWDSFIQSAPLYLFETTLTLLFVCAYIWVMYTLLGTRRWVYLPIGLIMVGVSVLPNLTNSNGFANGVTMPVTNLFNFTRQIYPTYTTLWGRLTQGALPALYNGFYMVMLVVLLGVLAWIVGRGRFYRHPRPPLILLTQGAALCALGVAWVYGSMTYDAGRQVYADERSIRQGISTWVMPADAPQRLTAYDLTLDLGAELPRFEARLSLTNAAEDPIETVDFTLYHALKIVDSSLPFTRERNYLRFTLPEPLAPGDSLDLTLTYEGELWRYVALPIAPAEPRDFIHLDGVNLSCGAWYPMPGRTVLDRHDHFYYDGQSSVIYHCLLPERARFSLVIKNPGHLRFASNLPPVGDIGQDQAASVVFTSQGATWASLIGSPVLAVRQIDNVRLISSQAEIDKQVSAVETYYAPYVDYLAKMFPDSPEFSMLTLYVIERSSSYYAYNDAYGGTVESAYAEPPPYFLTFGDGDETYAYTRYYSVSYMLTRSVFGASYSMLGDNLSQFLIMHFYYAGDVAQMRAIYDRDLAAAMMGVYDAETGKLVEDNEYSYYAATDALIDFYAEYGETALITLLGEMRTQYDTLRALELPAVADWIKEQTPS